MSETSNPRLRTLNQRLKIAKRSLDKNKPGSYSHTAALKRIDMIQKRISRLKKIKVGQSVKGDVFLKKEKEERKPKKSNVLSDILSKAKAKRKTAVKAPKEKPKRTSPREQVEKVAAKIRKAKAKRKAAVKAPKEKQVSTPVVRKKTIKKVKPISKELKKPEQRVAPIPKTKPKRVAPKQNISDVLAKEKGNVFAWPGSKYKEFSTKLKPEQRVAPIPKTKPKRVAPKQIFREVVEKKDKPVKQNIDFDSDARSDQEYYGTGKSKSKPKPKRTGILDTMFSGVKTRDFTPKDQTVKNPFTGSDMELSYDYPEDPDSVESMFSYKHGGWLGKGKRKALRGHRKERRGG